MPEIPKKKKTVIKITPPQKEHFESIGDFHVVHMTVGNGLEVLEKFPEYQREDAIEGLKLFLSLVSYADEECSTPLSKSQLSKVTTEELRSHFTKQIEEDDHYWFNVQDLEESELETHQTLLSEGSPEEHLYYTLHNNIPLGKSKHLSMLTGINDSVLKGFGSSVTDSFAKSFMFSDQLSKQLELIDKVTKPFTHLAGKFDNVDKIGQTFGSYEPKPLPRPEITAISPSPIHTINEKLENLDQRLDDMNQVAISTSKVMKQLNDTVLKFLLGFTDVANKSTRTTTIMIAIAMVGLLVSSGFSIASYFGSKSDTQNLSSIVEKVDDQIEASQAIIDTANEQRKALEGIGAALQSHTEVNQAILNQLKSLDKSNASLESILTQLKEANGHEKELVKKVEQEGCY